MSTESHAHRELEEKWGADNIPLGLSMDLTQGEIAGTGITRLPSFREILTHKLNMICRTCTPPEWNEVAKVLRVNVSVLRKWRAWTASPGGVLTLQRIDTAYEVAIDRLKLQIAKQK